MPLLLHAVVTRRPKCAGSDVLEDLGTLPHARALSEAKVVAGEPCGTYWASPVLALAREHPLPGVEVGRLNAVRNGAPCPNGRPIPDALKGVKAHPTAL